MATDIARRDQSAQGAASDASLRFWFELVDEKEIARFMGWSVRTVQDLRQRGGGPKFIRLSARCIKYRRIDGKEYAEVRLRSSTSDMGEGEE